MHNGSNRWRALLVAIVGLAAGLYGCQNPEEPSGVIVGSGFPTTVTVETESGVPIAGASVEWALMRAGVVGAFARMASGGVGVFTATIPFPVTDLDARAVFRTRPPFGSPEFLGVQKDGDVRLDTAAVCGETKLTFDLARRRTVTNCGAPLECGDVNLLVEVPGRLSDTACTDIVTNSTGTPLSMTVTAGPGIPVEVRTLIRIDNGDFLPLPQSVPGGSSFQICFIYTVTAGASASVTTTQITVVGSAGVPCIACDFTLRTEVNVGLVCDCPTDFPTITIPVSPAEDTVCIGASRDIVIPLTEIRNDNRDGLCDYLFELEKGSSDLDLLLIDFNGDPPTGTRLTPGTSLGNLRLRFRPTQARSYTDSVIYRVRLQNRGNNSQQDCATRLKVIYRGRGSEGSCLIDTASSTIFRKPGNTIDTIIQCVGLDLQQRTLRILNPSGCPLTMNAPTSSNPLFSATPAQLVIPPNGSGDFIIHFIPDPDSVWPGGRGARPGRLHFQADLTLLDCIQGQIRVPGVADTACRGTRSQALHAWGELRGNWFEGIAMDEATNAINYDNNRSLQGKRDIYIESIDLAGGRAVLGSDRARWRVIQSNRLPNSASETACDISPAYIGQCPTPGSAGTVTVQLWDVVIFDINGFCGIAWVIGIEPDRPVNGVPSVKLQICYPI